MVDVTGLSLGQRLPTPPYRRSFCSHFIPCSGQILLAVGVINLVGFTQDVVLGAAFLLIFE